MKNNRGFALVTALLILLVTCALSIIMIASLRQEHREIVSSKRLGKVLYIADGGIELAINSLKADASYSGTGEAALGEGTFIVTASSVSATRFEIIATGYIPNSTNCTSKRGIKAVVERTEEIPPVFGHAIACQGPLSLSGNAKTNSSPTANQGHVYSGTSISVKGNGQVNGNASTLGTITTQGNGKITGTQNPGCAPMSFPAIDSGYYLQEAQEGIWYGDLSYSGNGSVSLGPDAYINGDLSVSGNKQLTLSGYVYVTGEIKVTGNGKILGDATIVCDSDIQLAGNSDTGTIPLVMSVNGDVKVTGNADMGCFIYAENGTVTIAGNGDIHGGVIAQDVSVTGNGKVYYAQDASLDLPTDPSFASIDIVSWQEIK